MKIQLETNEKVIDSWTLNCKIIVGSQDKGKYVGKLTVTNQRVFFNAQHSLSAIAEYGRLVSIIQGDNATIYFPKSSISKIETSSGLFKKITVTLNADDTRFIIDRGIMSLVGVVTAMQQR